MLREIDLCQFCNTRQRLSILRYIYMSDVIILILIGHIDISVDLNTMVISIADMTNQTTFHQMNILFITLAVPEINTVFGLREEKGRKPNLKNLPFPLLGTLLVLEREWEKWRKRRKNIYFFFKKIYLFVTSLFQLMNFCD